MPDLIRSNRHASNGCLMSAMLRSFEHRDYQWQQRVGSGSSGPTRRRAIVGELRISGLSHFRTLVASSQIRDNPYQSNPASDRVQCLSGFA